MVKDALSVLMFCEPNKRWQPFSYHTKMVDFEYFGVLSVFWRKKKLAETQKSVLNMASSDSQIDKPQHRCPKRAEMLDVNTRINTGTQSINTEKASLICINTIQYFI